MKEVILCSLLSEAALELFKMVRAEPNWPAWMEMKFGVVERLRNWTQHWHEMTLCPLWEVTEVVIQFPHLYTVYLAGF